MCLTAQRVLAHPYEPITASCLEANSTPIDRLSGRENIPGVFFSARKRNKTAGSLVTSKQSILIVMLVVRKTQKHNVLESGYCNTWGPDSRSEVKRLNILNE
jgi:hypothetical protein